MKMPQAQGKKRNCDRDSSGTTKVDDSKCSNTTGIGLNSGISDDGSGKSRKRKRCDLVGFKDFESEFEGCDLEDAAALESTLRKVARKNSLTHEEMMKLLHKFVKNEHILALVTLKAENELAKQKQATEEQRAIIITETPSVPKLTRAKARELNKTPIIKLSTLNDQEPEPEITALIAEDLHSDEEDEEYVFKEEDFVSDDEINTTASDLESNPRTPQTPASTFVDSPIKLSDDRCFKIPSNKKNHKLAEEMRIAARTRSKLCLEQTTIEDLQSEFVPPDIEEHLETSDLQPLDEDWMQFLNDFTKPLSTSFITDDDDPINDPEYVAAEKEPVDAEELRDVNISKKELSELIAELYDGLMAEGLSMENIDLETPRKFLKDYDDSGLNTPHGSPKGLENNSNVARQLDFNKQQECAQQIQEAPTETSDTNAEKSRTIHADCNIITSTNYQSDYTFLADNSTNNATPTQKNNNDCNEEDNSNSEDMVLIPIAQSDSNSENSHNKTITIDSSAVNTDLNLIAVSIPGQPNCYQLARVVANTKGKTETLPTVKANENCEILKNTSSAKNQPHDQPYEINYVSIRRHIIAEYIDKFKTLQHAQDSRISSTTREITEVAPAKPNTSFTQYQYDLMQQQLRIHIQQLAQTFVQTYCHPELWKLAPKAKELLLDLQEKSKENVNFQVWNLEPAIELIHNWQKELDQNTPENTELMNFLYYENLVTTHYSRQIPRFHPRILECYLNSPVFLYPQYLPRMPFSGKSTIPVFSPVEAYLIAMGLEKHLKIIYDNKEKLSFKTTPLRVACRRLAKDTVCGKRYRRIWDHILHLQNVDYYNPIKYFFEHNKAPPVDHDPIWTFADNVVLPPKDRIPELPLVFQTYLQKKNEPPKPKNNKTKKSRKKSSPKASEAFRNSYLEFVREAVGQDLPIPNLFYDPVESSDTLPSDGDSNTAFAEKRRKLQDSNSTSKKTVPQSLTINVNYIYGNGLDVPTTSKNTSFAALPAPPCSYEYSLENVSSNPLSTSAINNEISECSENTLPATQLSNLGPNKNNITLDSTINRTIDLTQNDFNNTTINRDCPVITYNFDWRTKTLQLAEQAEVTQPNSVTTAFVNNTSTPAIAKVQRKKLRIFKKHINTFKLHRRIKKRASAYREKRYLKRRCEELITTYSLYLDKIILKYQNYPLIQHYYRRFKTLELYTYLLEDLKSICKKYSNIMSNSLNGSPNMKRARCSNSNVEEDNSPSSVRQVRKLNRQEENLKQMIMPDTPEEVNRKDAIYAFNFYEKVEDAFKAANKPEDCKKFNAILRSFDPKKDKVSDLYYKLEKLFLPDHPELAQVFLTFLLPSEAAEIGKFFEHFMINNMNTFINKLNIYFNKQPAQIRKIYNCLNDLAEDPDVTMKKVEAKILPLLKGNQFLIDWFMQQFPQSTPPERLFSKPEHINLKDQQCNRSREYVEAITDPLESSPIDTQQQRNCQLRYINGRIFYGSKMLLPAKLSFIATSYKDAIQPNETITAATFPNTCVHGIREHGEKRLQSATDLSSGHISSAEPPSDDQDKSEEEDISKTLVIDTTAEEEDSCSSVELCDETTLRAHAARLNPSVYSTTCYATVNATSTPNFTNNTQPHQHSNVKKTFLNFNEEPKLSPRKSFYSSTTTTQSNLNSPLATSICNSPINPKEKRKSPSKKTKSPLSNSHSNKHLRPNNFATPPMVVIHETNSAIQCAKRLKSLIDEEEQQNDNMEEIIDSKELIKIVARTKTSIQSTESTSSQICENFKEERPEDLEFLPEHSALSPSPFPCLRMETDSNEEDACTLMTATPPLGQRADPISDVDCKIDIVTSLTADSAEVNSAPTSNAETQLAFPLNSAWTRDEDKIILIEMKMGSQNRKELYERIAAKLPERKMLEITSRHQFLMDFLSKLQGK